MDNKPNFTSSPKPTDRPTDRLRWYKKTATEFHNSSKTHPSRSSIQSSTINHPFKHHNLQKKDWWCRQQWDSSVINSTSSSKIKPLTDSRNTLEMLPLLPIQYWRESYQLRKKWTNTLSSVRMEHPWHRMWSSSPTNTTPPKISITFWSKEKRFRKTLFSNCSSNLLQMDISTSNYGSN